MEQALRAGGALALVAGVLLAGGCTATGSGDETPITYQIWPFDYSFPVLWDGVTKVLQDEQFPLARRADPTTFPAVIESKLREERVGLTDVMHHAQQVLVRIERQDPAQNTYRVGFAVIELERPRDDGDEWTRKGQDQVLEKRLISSLRKEMEARSAAP